MYKRQTWDAGEYRVVKNYHTHKHPGKRRKREKPSSLSVEHYNRKLREEKVQLLILSNFEERDLWVTLTYKKDGRRPANTKEAKRILQRFLRKLKAWYRHEGSDLKWIGMTEKGKKGAYHHHLLLNRLPGLHEKIDELWTWGHPSVVRLYEDQAFKKLAEYIVKSESKDDGEFLKYSRSRNLTVPEAKEETITSSTFIKDPRGKKGWILLPETLEAGINPVTGYMYQRYVMKRVRHKLE